jgi:hypothetical protein
MLKRICADWMFWGGSYTNVSTPGPMCLEAPSCAEHVDDDDALECSCTAMSEEEFSGKPWLKLAGIEDTSQISWWPADYTPNVVNYVDDYEAAEPETAPDAAEVSDGALTDTASGVASMEGVAEAASGGVVGYA